MGLLTYTYEDMRKAYDEGAAWETYNEYSNSHQALTFVEFMHAHYPEETENQYKIAWYLGDIDDHSATEELKSEIILAESKDEAIKAGLKLLKDKDVLPSWFKVWKI